jgi:predicted HTH domain antitoxin
MSKRFTLELELPDDVAATLADADVASKAKEALVMELLREHCVSQGKAAELLCVSRTDLFPLMSRYKVPVVDLSHDELQKELRQPFPSRPS